MLKQTRHWLDSVMFGIRAVWGVNGIVSLYLAEGTGWLFWLGALGFLLSCCLPFALWKRPGVPRFVPPVAELLITGSLFLLLGGGTENMFKFFQVPFLTLGYLCAGWSLTWTAAIVLALPFVLTGGIPAMEGGAFADSLFNWLVLLGMGFCFRKLVDSYHKINRMYGIISKQNATLEIYAKQIEQLTLAEERNRLSRDLHDTVGHTFTASIMGMDAVYCLIDSAPQEAKSNLRELLQLMRGGLDEVRRHIHAIAPEKEKSGLSAALREIGGEFALHTGMKVTVETEGAEYPVSEQVRLTLIRCLQESLTNAKKHGMAGEARIGLTFDSEGIVLTVQDDGEGADHPEKGFGLQSMTERLSNLNGTLDISTSPGRGMRVCCAVPVLRPPAGEAAKEGA